MACPFGLAIKNPALGGVGFTGGGIKKPASMGGRKDDRYLNIAYFRAKIK
jgi:hypothetical protein